MLFKMRAPISIMSTSALHLPLRVWSAHLRVLPLWGLLASLRLNFFGSLRCAKTPSVMTPLGQSYPARLAALRLKTLANKAVLAILPRVLVALRINTLSFDSLRVISHTAVLAGARTKTLSYDKVGPLGSIVALLQGHCFCVVVCLSLNPNERVTECQPLVYVTDSRVLRNSPRKMRIVKKL